VPMAASQYPATATPAGDRMTGPMIAIGYSPPTGDGLSSAGLGAEPGGIRRWHAGLAGAVTRRAQGACAAARPGTRVGSTGCLQRASRTGAGPGCWRVTRPTGHGRAGPASVSTGGVPAWV
jgi:hypothetical protein